ncbi:MAG: rod shape-determining protein MreB [Firmicutes bacterium]|nr:rod shape-determining protein MreB [Bacillota bacterium]
MSFNLGYDIGVDLGTASILIYVKGKGVVLREPSVVAIDEKQGKIVAIGDEAKSMLGRTPANIVAVRPLRDGVIANYDITLKMLKHFIGKAISRSMVFRPRIMICIPSGVTGVEERAVRQSAMEAGAREVYLIEEPLAAAIGADLDITKPYGQMIIDIGGGTTDIAVISLQGIVCSRSIRLGGDKFDEAIVRYIRRHHNLQISERFAEDLKIAVGTAFPHGLSENMTMEVRGRDLLSGMPKSISFSSVESFEAMQEPLENIVTAVRQVLAETPPELCADIMENGITLTGGGAMLHGIDLLLQKQLGLRATVADDPISCVARGTGKALQQVHNLKNAKSIVEKSV